MGEFKVVSGRDPAAMPWKDLGVEVIIESTGAFNSLEGGSKHLDAGAKKVVLTAPGKNCPTYVVGVNEGDYDPENDVVVSNASCTTNGVASVAPVRVLATSCRPPPVPQRLLLRSCPSTRA